MRFKIRHLKFINRAHEDDVLKLLSGEVFHLTTKQAFDQIKSDGFIFHNQNRRFKVNTSLKNSSGRKRGCVCLFDLRNKGRDDIDDTFDRYNFIEPPWFCVDGQNFSEYNLAYLILNASCCEKIVSSEEVKEVCFESNEPEFYIPKTECWYPGDLPLACIREVIIVRIFQYKPNPSPFLQALKQIAFKNRNKTKSK